jgi:hypothetical protein
MQATLKGLWVKYLPTRRRTSFLLSLDLVGCASFGLSMAFHFVFHVMVPTIGFLFICHFVKSLSILAFSFFLF